MAKNKNAYRDTRIKNGQCSHCGAVSTSRLCTVCKGKHNELRRHLAQSRTLSGVCNRCGKSLDDISNSLVCIKCWFKNIASVCLKSYKYADELERLFNEQNKCCAYSGQTLLPAVNATLDHKIPVSRGGTNSLDNIHWVSRDINRIKGTLTHDEFVSLCKKVASEYE